jgi:hypothetical protein
VLKGRTRGRYAPPCGHHVGPHGAPYFPPRRVPRCSSHGLLNPVKMTWQRLGPFDIWKVPKSKQTCKNKKICFTMLKPNKGGRLENPRNQ